MVEAQRTLTEYSAKTLVVIVAGGSALLKFI